MDESTLIAAYDDLRVDVAYHLGYTRTVDNWNQRQLDNLAATLKTGSRQFYFCGEPWSFLKPVRSVTLHSGQNVCRLPGDYGACEGPITVSVDGQGSFYRQLRTGPAQDVYLREKRMPNTPGSPAILCEEVAPGSPNARQSSRVQFHVWPTADADYTLTFPMKILPNALTGELPFAYGGADHSQTLLQSCKAAAERDIDSIGPQSPAAIQQPEFARMLEISKTLDRRRKPHTVGVMWDRSDLRRHRVPGSTPRPLLPILVQGTLYD
jgi:hypothetical protein